MAHSAGLHSGGTPVARSQRMTSLSAEPDNTFVPSEENTAECTFPECPLSTCSTAPATRQCRAAKPGIPQGPLCDPRLHCLSLPPNVRPMSPGGGNKECGGECGVKYVLTTNTRAYAPKIRAYRPTQEHACHHNTHNCVGGYARAFRQIKANVTQEHDRRSRRGSPPRRSSSGALA